MRNLQTELSADQITEEVGSKIVSQINGLTESAKLFRFSTRHSLERVAKQLGIRRQAKFSPRDLTTATKAVGRAGVSISRFEIEPNGKIVIVTDKGGAPLDDDLNRELAEFEARHAR